jgi:D-xylose 1-dehydrogenase (NADP+, D-xylono-1,5-lactone-forming)
MKERVYRWGFLGYGQVARERMMPAVTGHGRAVCTAVATKSHGNEAVPAETLYCDYEQLLEDERVDIVYIALPNTLHVEWTLKALERGKHVLCEKPLAMKTSDLDAVQAAAERTGLKVMEGFMYRCSERMGRLQQVIDSGILGKLRYVQSNFFSLSSRIAGIRADKSLGGGSLWDLGCYPVSLITALLGQEEAPALIQAAGAAEGDIDTALTGTVAYSSGVMGSFACGWLSEVRDITTMIIGTRGIAEVQRLFNWDEGRLRVTTVEGVSESVLPAEDPFAREIDAFTAWIEEGTKPPMDLDESRRVLACMERIADSMVLLPEEAARD